MEIAIWDGANGHSITCQADGFTQFFVDDGEEVYAEDGELQADGTILTDHGAVYGMDGRLID